MKITINSKQLLTALITAAKAVPSKSPNTILEGFLIQCKGGGISITATDTHTTIITEVPCEQAEGEAVIPASMLVDSVRSLPDTEITLSTEGNTLTIDYGFGKHSMQVWDTQDYPTIRIPEGEQFSLGGPALANGISHVSGAIGTDAMRPVLNGVCFTGCYGVELAASDQHVLSKMIVPSVDILNFQFVVPSSCIKTVKDLAQNEKEVKITNGDVSAVFKIGTTTLITQKIVGKFPDYRTLFDRPTDKTMKVDRANFLQVIRRIAICASKASGQIRMDLSQDECKVSSVDLALNTSATEVFNAEYEGEPLTIGMKVASLDTILSPMDCDKVTLKFNDARKAVYIESEGDPMKSLVMPVTL